MRKKDGLLVLVMFYFVYVFIGVLLIEFPEIETLKPLEYAPLLFYMFGFFSLLTYFITRKKKDYELLFLGLINMVSATGIIFCSSSVNTSIVLGNIILIYSLLVIINKIIHTYLLSKEKDIKMFPKLTNTIMLSVLGFLTFKNLISNTTMATLMLGYYIVVFGILSLIEVTLDLYITTNDKMKKYLNNIINS